MTAADDGDFGYAGDLPDHPLDLGSGDVLAADFQHVLVAVGKVKESVLAQACTIAGDEQWSAPLAVDSMSEMV